MRRRRALLVAAGLAGLLVLLAGPLAMAGTDLYGNVGPGQSLSGIAGRYPLGSYVLDQHFDAVSASLTGGVDASGIPPMIAYFLANLVWQITAFLANAVITLFTFAFSLDLLNGSAQTGGAGALAPVSSAIRGIYAHTFGEAWMVAGVVLAGCWAMWKALVQRRYTETAGALAVSLVFCVIALAVVSRPAETIGQVSRWTNQISTSFLSITSDGDVTSGERAKQSTADALFRLLVYEPWVALEFGGTEHCTKTGTGSADHDPESVPVRPLSAATRARMQSGQPVATGGRVCVSNTSRYASRFLQYASGSDERDGEYDAINHGDPGKLPKTDHDSGYKPGVADKPAVDAMEKGGQYQRLLLALVIFAGELGVFLLLGALSVSVVLAQVLVLLLACFAPVALVLGVIPGRGHDFFRAWLARLGSLLLRKAAYSLVLAVLLAVMAALQSAATGLGWLMAFGLQAALAWTVFLQRRQLAGRITAVATGRHSDRDDEALGRLASFYLGSRVLTGAARRLRHPDQPTRPLQPIQEQDPGHPSVRRDEPSDEATEDGVHVALSTPSAAETAAASGALHTPIDPDSEQPSTPAAGSSAPSEPLPRRAADQPQTVDRSRPEPVEPAPEPSDEARPAPAPPAPEPARPETRSGPATAATSEEPPPSPLTAAAHEEGSLLEDLRPADPSQSRESAHRLAEPAEHVDPPPAPPRRERSDDPEAGS